MSEVTRSGGRVHLTVTAHARARRRPVISSRIVEEVTTATERPAAARFARVCDRVVGALPPPLEELVAPTLVGYLGINGTTFVVDLLLLTMLRDAVGLPVWVAVAGSYAVALGLAFAGNRTLNFRSHRPVGSQLVRYVAVVALNYGVVVVGATTLLTDLGVALQVSRLVAGAVEAVLLYLAMRWLVFAGGDATEGTRSRPPA